MRRETPEENDISTGRRTLDSAYEAGDALTPARIAAELLNRWRLVALVTLAVTGLACLAWYALLTPLYGSEAYIAIDQDSSGRQKAIIFSPAVLDPVIEAHPGPGSRDRQRADLRASLTVVPARGEDPRYPTVFAVTVTDADPQKAQDIAKAILDRYMQISRPGDTRTAELERELERALAQREKLDGLVAQLDAQVTPPAATGNVSGDAAVGLAQLIVQRGETEDTIAMLMQQLEGQGDDIVLSPPTLPDVALRPVPLAAVAAAGLLLGLVAAIGYVLARYVLPLWLHGARGARKHGSGDA